MFKIECEKALATKCQIEYTGIAFDGCSFYLSERCENRICKFDVNLQFEKCFDTRRSYTYFCFDIENHCFWAVTNNIVPIIYRLNECFEEIERIKVQCGKTNTGAITGISVNCCENKLIVSFAFGIVQINLCHTKQCTVLIQNTCKWIIDAVSVCPYIFCHCQHSHMQTICIYTDCGKLLCEKEIPIGMNIVSAVFVPCIGKHLKSHFYLLTIKDGGYPYIVDCIIDSFCFNKSFCKCNFDICFNDCHDNCDCKDGCADILESIALVETSIAHILNAEGEKIQKVLASTDDVCEILEVNESVRRTIEKATHLELILFDKMDLLRELCCFCDEDDCNDNDCDCNCDCDCDCE